jgi:hypothetical protein
MFCAPREALKCYVSCLGAKITPRTKARTGPYDPPVRLHHSARAIGGVHRSRQRLGSKAKFRTMHCCSLN